jgi:hypothetical protein
MPLPSIRYNVLADGTTSGEAAVHKKGSAKCRAFLNWRAGRDESGHWTEVIPIL